MKMDRKKQRGQHRRLKAMFEYIDKFVPFSDTEQKYRHFHVPSSHFNMERHATGYNHALSIYRTSDFSLERRLFETDPKTEVCTIEFDPAANDCYLLGFFRDEKNSASEYFVARLCDEELKDFKCISADVYDFYTLTKNSRQITDTYCS